MIRRIMNAVYDIRNCPDNILANRTAQAFVSTISKLVNIERCVRVPSISTALRFFCCLFSKFVNLNRELFSRDDGTGYGWAWGCFFFVRLLLYDYHL
jgi:hypothetical protein